MMLTLMFGVKVPSVELYEKTYVGWDWGFYYGVVVNLRHVIKEWFDRCGTQGTKLHMRLNNWMVAHWIPMFGLETRKVIWSIRWQI